MSGALDPSAPASEADLAESVAGEGAMERHARFVDANMRRNFSANLIHGIFGMTGFRLIYAPTIIPAYIHLLTGSASAVGLGTALLQLGGTISPIASGTRVETRRFILPYAVRVGSMMRVMLLGLALAGWFLTGNQLLGVTFVLFLLLGFFSGAQRVAFQMLMAKVIPIRRRGRLQGYRNVVGGLIAAVLAWFAGHVMIEQSWFGNGYATTFLLAFVLTSIGLFALQLLIREPEAPARRSPLPWRERIAELPKLLHNPDFRHFLTAQGFATAARVGLPFWTIFVGDRLGLNGALIGGLSLAFLGADTVSNLAWGAIGDRYGFRIVYLLSLGATLAGLILLVTGTTAFPLYGAFAMMGVGSSGWMMASATMVLEFGAHEDIPMRLAFATTVEGAVAAIGPLVAGALVGLFGYTPLIVITFIALAVAALVTMTRIREPRTVDQH
ncbi:MFS transporter [Novosphingobium tardum]|uniref:MFS transporter n=1 Tax=Novosphingobium tardum TaxID=1538021 RepID=A0ABV8RP91_9SPHN